MGRTDFPEPTSLSSQTTPYFGPAHNGKLADKKDGDDGTLTPDDVIDRLGGCGRFQMALSVVIQTMKIVVCWGMSGNAFFAYTPDWRCADAEDGYNGTNAHAVTSSTQYNLSGNVTQQPPSKFWNRQCKSISGESCGHFEFDTSMRTFVTDFGLVCGQSWVKAFLTSLQMGGMCVGSVLAGQLSDIFGRKLPLFVSMATLALLHLVACFCTNWHWLAACRVGIGVGSAFFLTIYGTLQSEFAVSRWRAVMVSFPSWALESAGFALAAWLLHDWVYLTAIMAAMAGIFFITCCFVPESFRWYIAKHRYDEAERVIKKVASVNGRSTPDLSRMRSSLVMEKEPARKYSFIVLFTKMRLLKLTVPIMIAWLTMGLVSYGINFGIQQLAGNIYLNLFIFAIASVPAKLASMYLQNRFGRRRACMMSLSLCLLGGLAVGAIQYIDTPYRDDVTTYCALVASLAMDSTWGPMQTLTLEVYPTVIRNTGFGFASVMSRLGAVIGPQFAFLNELVPGLLYMTVGATCLLSIVGVVTLPETMDTALEDRLDIGLNATTDRGENKDIQCIHVGGKCGPL